MAMTSSAVSVGITQARPDLRRSGPLSACGSRQHAGCYRSPDNRSNGFHSVAVSVRKRRCAAASCRLLAVTATRTTVPALGLEFSFVIFTEGRPHT